MTPAQTVIAAVGLVVERKVAVFPVEGSGIDDHSTDPVAVSAQPLGQGVHHDGGSMLDGLGQVGGGKGAVDDERNALVRTDLGDRLDVGHVQPRVADGFAKRALVLSVMAAAKF